MAAAVGVLPVVFIAGDRLLIFAVGIARAVAFRFVALLSFIV